MYVYITCYLGALFYLSNTQPNLLPKYRRSSDFPIETRLKPQFSPKSFVIPVSHVIFIAGSSQVFLSKLNTNSPAWLSISCRTFGQSANIGGKVVRLAFAAS